ncbi:DUF86 domain-containing protein [Candidatus Poribacteria bacterium]|nr:DUF86 domain-containing protein [Candidatus Poribacteria bacterium]
MITYIDKLHSIFKLQDGIIAIYLFGSQVRGNTDPFSDYDFAVLFTNGYDGDKKRKIIRDLLCNVFSVVGQDKADIIDLSEAPLWFQEVVLKTGKVIYETDREERIVYENELFHKLREAGSPEYVEDGKMKRQDVRINLETIDGNLEKLEALRRFSYQEFVKSFWYLDAAIRQIQTSIEALIDVSRYIIRSLNLPFAKEYWEVPVILGNAGYIEKDDVAIYVEMVSFRNLVVHFYYKVKPEEIYRIIHEDLPYIRKWRDSLLKVIEES